MTAAPARPDPRADWVVVGRLTGQLDGPITARPTPAELRAALATGTPPSRIADRARMSLATLNTLLQRGAA